MKKFLSILAGLILLSCASGVSADDIITTQFGQSVYKGNSYLISSQWDTLLPGSAADVLVHTASDGSIQMIVDGSSNGNVYLKVYESPTCTASGQLTVPINMNRTVMTNPVASRCLITATTWLNPTVTASGTHLVTYLIASGSNATLKSELTDKFYLHVASDYLVVLENADNVTIRGGINIRLIEKVD